jgi:cytoskeletal protein RodZ
MRGFVRNYAIYLGLSPRELVTALPGIVDSTSSITKRAAPDGDYPLMEMPLQPGTSWLSLEFIVGALLLIVVIGLGGWWGYTSFLRPYLANRPTPTAVAIVRPLPTRVTPAPSSTPANVQPTSANTARPVVVPTQTEAIAPSATPTDIPPAAPTATATPVLPALPGIETRLSVQDVSWVEVVSDGEVRFRGFLLEGESEVFQATERLQLHLGNAGGVRVVVNDEDLGFLGQDDQVVHKEFRVEGAGPAEAPSPTSTPAG